MTCRSRLEGSGLATVGGLEECDQPTLFDCQYTFVCTHPVKAGHTWSGALAQELNHGLALGMSGGTAEGSAEHFVMSILSLEASRKRLIDTQEHGRLDIDLWDNQVARPGWVVYEGTFVKLAQRAFGLMCGVVPEMLFGDRALADK